MACLTLKITFKFFDSYRNCMTVLQKPETIDAIVQDTIPETANTVTLRLALQGGLSFIPGQALGIDPKQFPALQERIADREQWAREAQGRQAKNNMRLYSIASSPTQPFVELTIQHEESQNGYPSPLLSPYIVHSMQRGDPITVKGPYGKKFLFYEKLADEVIFLCGGSGVVPCMGIARSIVDQGLSTRVLFLDSNQTPEKIIYRKELEVIAGQLNIRVIRTITRPNKSREQWSGRIGRFVTEEGVFSEDIAKEIKALEQPRVYICGPNAFGKAMKQAAITEGIPSEHIEIESYG